MPNFFALPRPEYPKEGPKTFVEPRYRKRADLAVHLVLQALDPIQMGAVSTTARDMLRKYVGSPEDGIEAEEMFPPLEGYIVNLNEDTAMKAARLFHMQRPGEYTTDKGEKLRISKLDFEDFVAMAVTMPKVWDEVLDWHYRLNNAARALPKNPDGAESTGE